MKNFLRAHWKQKRGQISKFRRTSAEKKGMHSLLEESILHTYVLSFASFRDEFSTRTLNSLLATQGKLLLPRIEENRLAPYLIQDPKNQLILNKYGIWEPCPSHGPNRCHPFPLSQISLVFVPGLAYDTLYHRLGYGKGFYDRFLSSLSSDVISLGVGFQEQASINLLPTEEGDFKLTALRLF